MIATMIGTPAEPDMTAARLRLGRARLHMQQLLEEVSRYDRAGPYSAVADDEADDAGQFSYRLRVDPSPPQEWSLILGDAVHNARAAMEYAVVAMAAASAGRELTDEETKHLQFPLFVDQPRPSFAELTTAGPRTRGMRTGRLWGLAEVFVDRVERVQPYNGWRYAWADEPQLANSMIGVGNFLARLDRLSNQEKHRRLALMTADLRGGHIVSTADAGSGLAILARSAHGCPPLVEGCVVAVAPSRDLAATVSPTAVIAVEDEAAGQPWPVEALLPAVIAEVSNVLSFLATGEVFGPDWA